MLRAKDLSNYSSEDKSAIFGGVPQNTTAPSVQEDSDATQQDVGSESEVCLSREGKTVLQGNG